MTPQAFTLLNSPQSAGRALALAKRVLKESETKEGAIDRAFLLASGRKASAGERQACLLHWESMKTRHQTLQLEKPTTPTKIIREAVEENTGVKFTYEEILEAAADFVPDPHPADASPEVRGLMDVCLVLLNASEFAYVD